MMYEYPTVADEFTTLFKLHSGFSISRFGDGELKLIDGAEYVREPTNAKLGAELRAILDKSHRNCIVGIPTFAPEGPKVAHWRRHERRFLKYLNGKRDYYSAFISRPDSAPWINMPAFAVLTRRLWLDKNVVVLCEDTSSTLRLISQTARSVHHISCPSHEAFKHIDDYEYEIFHRAPEIVFMSCGPTASCLANRLAVRGIQAIDFGSGGGFLLKLLKNE